MPPPPAMDSWLLTISLSLCLSSLALIFVLRYSLPTRRTDPRSTPAKGRLPPGPPSPLLGIGNLLWLQRDLVDLVGEIGRIAGEYGPIFRINFGLFPAVFVSDRELAREVLVERGATFSDRAGFPPDGAAAVYSSNGHIITACSGALWRRLRRNLTAEILHPSRLRSYAPGRSWALARFLVILRSEAAAGRQLVAFAEHLRTPMLGMIAYMCFGEKLEGQQMKDLRDAQQSFLAMGFELNVFDMMPRLAKIFLPKKWRAFLDTRRKQEQIIVPLVQARRALTAPGEKGVDGVVSYVDTLLGLELPEEGGRKLDDGEIVSLCSELLNAGFDTTASTLQWVMANLVKFPAIQKKLFDEIRAVVGEEEGSDEVEEDVLPQISYLKAVILESLRRHPPAPLLLPHVAAEAATLRGYTIPKGAEVNVAVAELGWDEKVWEDPMVFRPERFVAGGEGEGLDLTGSREIKMMPFGAGRRICPGLALAMLHLEYFVANLVWQFEWMPADGEEEAIDLSPTVEFTMTMKHPLRARIQPRRRT